MQIKQLIAQAVADLQPDPGARIDAEYLLCHVLQQTQTFLRIHSADEVNQANQAKFDSLVHARKQGCPVAYLTGTKGFWKYDFCVNPATLIPRPETELLIETTLTLFDPKQPTRMLDLGTGSGAIAISLALESPAAWQILATDVSPHALNTARHNATRLQARNVTFLESDWFRQIPPTQFDLIVSNPPYIAAADPHLTMGDLRFEPHAALASGPSGLDAIETIIHTAAKFLNPHGILMFEHGYDQAESVQKCLRLAGFDAITTVNDLQNWPRVTFGKWR